MHGARGRRFHLEYDWRQGTRVDGADRPFCDPRLLSDLVSALHRRDIGDARPLLDRLPSGRRRARPRRRHRNGGGDRNPPPLDPTWEPTPPARRVTHEAARGEKGALASVGCALDTIRTLRACGLETDVPDTDGRTPLWHASYCGEVDVVRYLISKEGGGCDANSRDLGGYAPIHAAVEGRHKEVATVLVKEGKADVNTQDHRGWTALHAAAEIGRLDMVALLHNLGAEVDTPNDEGQTALHTVAVASWETALCREDREREDCPSALDAVKFLTASPYNADADFKDDNGSTPLIQAAWRTKGGGDRYEVMHFFLEQCGADISASSSGGSTVLHRAAQDGLPDEVRYMVKKGSDPQVRNTQGATPLHDLFYSYDFYDDAASPERLAAARFLVSEECSSLAKNGVCADVNAKDGEGWTPLLCLLDCNRLDSEKVMAPVRFLVNELGADIAGVSDEQGNTPLHICLKGSNNSKPGVINFLLDKDGAQIEARDAEGLTPLHTRIRNYARDDLVATLRLLHERGANVNTVAIDGQTALHSAVLSGGLEIMKALVDMGADLDIPNRDGLSALHLAKLCTRRSHDLPAELHWMSEKTLLSRFGPIVKYLVDVGATLIPTWWTPSNLVGCNLSDGSRRALEKFVIGRSGGSSAGIRPHVLCVVRAQRVLEAASIYESGTKVQIENLVSARNLGGATKVLMNAMAEKAVETVRFDGFNQDSMVDGAMRDKETCPICFSALSNVDKVDGSMDYGYHISEDDKKDENKDHGLEKATGEPLGQDGGKETCDNEDDRKPQHSNSDNSKAHKLEDGEESWSGLGEEESGVNEKEKESRDDSMPHLVSCPNHHAMHAGCLADLLLGGDMCCPICRARMPVATNVDLRSLTGEQRNMGQASPFSADIGALFPTRPLTVGSTVAAVECRAREMRNEEGTTERARYRNGSECQARDRPSVPHDFLVQARDELLRNGRIDGALLVRGSAKLKVSWQSSLQAFGILDSGVTEENITEEKSAGEGANDEKAGPSIALSCFDRGIGFGVGLLDARVQQNMLTGELVRVKEARDTVKQQLQHLKVEARKQDKEGEEEEEDVIDTFVSSRQAQTESRKREAKLERRRQRLFGASTATLRKFPSPPGLGSRVLSDDSKRAIASLNCGIDGVRDEGNSFADESRGHRYLELVAPLKAEKELEEQLQDVPSSQNKVMDTNSKEALRAAVADGQVDSAARHLRRGRIVSHVQQTISSDVGVGADREYSEDFSDQLSLHAGSSKITKKQRKRQAMLRRQEALRKAAGAEGHPICCSCHRMVVSSSLKPLHQETGTSAFSVQMAAESLAENHATCVNGHIMHATCYLWLVATASPCPACNELLVSPPIVRRGNGDDNCCGADGNDADGARDGGENELLDARLDFMAMTGLRFDDEDEFGKLVDGEDEAGDGGVLSDLRQCPSCNFGPLYNAECDDLATHHGECQRCHTRVCSRLELDGIVADRLAALRAERKMKTERNEEMSHDDDEDEGLVIKAVPDCPACQLQGVSSKAWYNGCMRCGLSFSSSPWDSLPLCPLDMYPAGVKVPRRMKYLARVRRDRTTARSVAALAEHLQDEVVALLHEEQALRDERRRNFVKGQQGVTG